MGNKKTGLTPEIRDKVIQNIEAGVFHLKTIADKVGISVSSVQKIKKEYFNGPVPLAVMKAYENYKNRPREGTRKIQKDIVELIKGEISDFMAGLTNLSKISEKFGVSSVFVSKILKENMTPEEYDKAIVKSRRQTFNLNNPNINKKMPIIIDKIISEGFVPEELAEALGVSVTTLTIRIETYLGKDPEKLKAYKQFMLARKERKVVAIKTLDDDIKEFVFEKILQVINDEISTGKLTRMINKEFSSKYGRAVRIDANLIRRFIRSCLQKNDKNKYGRRIKNQHNMELKELLHAYDKIFKIECCKLAEFFEQESENSETTVQCAEALARCAEVFEEMKLETYIGGCALK